MRSLATTVACALLLGCPAQPAPRGTVASTGGEQRVERVAAYQSEVSEAAVPVTVDETPAVEEAPADPPPPEVTATTSGEAEVTVGPPSGGCPEGLVWSYPCGVEGCQPTCRTPYEAEVDRRRPSVEGAEPRPPLARSCPTIAGEPAFGRGDPCEAAQSGCAWSTTARRCVPFVPVAACPSTLAGAQAADVRCDHSGQPSLSCDYGRTHCACIRSQYCGGAAPPPWLEHPAAQFVCVPPVDAQGCPTSPIRDGARCRVDAAVQCTTCTTMSRCEGGRWRTYELPPRP